MARRGNWVEKIEKGWDYHRPLSQAEMAARGNVSKMAVSRAINHSMRNFFYVLIDEFPDLSIIEIIKNVAGVFKIHSDDEIHSFVLTLPGEILALLEAETGMKIMESHSKKMYRRVKMVIEREDHYEV